MDTITTQMPAVAPEACPSCGAQLAADQRYCLNCGARRGDARVPFMEILGNGGAVRQVPLAPAPVGDTARSQRNLTVVASIGCLLLALGVGVLIGKGGRGDKGASTAAPAQVISVQGGGAGVATPAAAGATKKPGAAKKAKSGGAASSSSSSHSTNKTIKNLNNLSPEQYQKQSQKLPKTVGTGGKPPPKDSKPAAGGGNFQSFG